MFCILHQMSSQNPFLLASVPVPVILKAFWDLLLTFLPSIYRDKLPFPLGSPTTIQFPLLTRSLQYNTWLFSKNFSTIWGSKAILSWFLAQWLMLPWPKSHNWFFFKSLYPLLSNMSIWAYNEDNPLGHSGLHAIFLPRSNCNISRFNHAYFTVIQS